MIDEESRPRNMFIFFRLLSLFFVIPILVFVVFIYLGYLELGIILAIMCFLIYGFVFWKYLLPKV